MVHIPYRGIAPAFTDLIGGQTQAMFPGLAAAVPHIRSGRVRPLAVTGLARHPQFKDLPTLDESGFKGFDAQQWYGVVGPAGMPAAVVQPAQRHAGHRADRARAAREAVHRGGGAQPDEPGPVRRLHARRHRPLDRSWPRPATSSSTADPPVTATRRPPWPATPRSPPTTTPRPSRSCWRSSSPPTLAAAGATRSTTKPTAPS